MISTLLKARTIVSEKALFINRDSSSFLSQTLVEVKHTGHFSRIILELLLQLLERSRLQRLESVHGDRAGLGEEGAAGRDHDDQEAADAHDLEIDDCKN